MTDVPGSRPPRSTPGFAVPAALEGRVVLPGDERYDAARLVFNAAIDRHPAAIVLARDAADVAAAIRLSDDTGLPLTVRAGGHSTNGLSIADGAILLDLAGLGEIEIDEADVTVTVGAGVTAGALIAAIHPLGYTVPFGDFGGVGIAGITVGGGIGWLVRRYGMTIDSLLGVELVLANGERVTANETEHPDLFWAIRGGGGNFGVLTRLRFRMREVTTVLHGDVIVRATPDSLGRLVEVLATAPDGLTVMPSIFAAPPMPELPESWHGSLVVFLSFAHSGPEADDEAIVALLRSLGESATAGIERKPYPALFAATSDERTAYTAGTLFVDDLDPAAIAIIERRMADGHSPNALVHLRVLGGEYARVSNDSTAFAHRDRRAAVWLLTPYDDVAERARHEAWTAAFEAELLEAGCGSGAYSNFLGTTGDRELHAAYPSATLARLSAIKRRYDPANLFRSNLNIPPAQD